MMTSPNEKNKDKSLSPCVRNCCLDENDVCVGCYRSLSEILNWRELPLSEKKAIMERSQLNKKG
jgi:predicted Fe-S protein YdhL (DUF1289 family)